MVRLLCPGPPGWFVCFLIVGLDQCWVNRINTPGWVSDGWCVTGRPENNHLVASVFLGSDHRAKLTVRINWLWFLSDSPGGSARVFLYKDNFSIQALKMKLVCIRGSSRRENSDRRAQGVGRTLSREDDYFYSVHLSRELLCYINSEKAGETWCPDERWAVRQPPQRSNAHCPCISETLILTTQLSPCFPFSIKLLLCKSH